MKKEIWKDIKGYEGLYQVSNLDRVKRLNYNQTDKERIMKPIKHSSGYLQIILFKNGKMKHMYVHRLVALHFIPNPEVNHKDENKLNNHVSNLEWCTHSYNNLYGTRIERISNKLINGKQSKPVLQYDLDGNLIKEWESTAECGRNSYNKSSISKCCRGVEHYKTAYDYIWRYKNGED